MAKFISPRLLISDYFDSLVNEVDLRTEELIKQHENNNIELNLEDENENHGTTKKRFDSQSETYGFDSYNDPYSTRYRIEDILKSNPKSHPNTRKIIDYFNLVRMRSIDVIESLKVEILENYELNKDRYSAEIDEIRRSKNDEKSGMLVENLRKRLFEGKFCFVLKLADLQPGNFLIADNCLFRFCTLLTDFYLNENEIKQLQDFFNREFYVHHQCSDQFENDLHKLNFDEKTLLIQMTSKYASDLLRHQSYGMEVIRVKKEAIFAVDGIFFNFMSIKNIDIDINTDLSAVKSINIQCAFDRKYQRTLTSLKGAQNLEYLRVKSMSFSRIPFDILPNLICLKLEHCDLTNFDFDFLSKLVNLKVLKIHSPKLDVHRSNNINLKSLTNLKWLDLHHINLSAKSEPLVDLNQELIVLKLTECHINDENITRILKNLNRSDLVLIDLSDNHLTSFRKWYHGLNSLRDLNLRNNQIKRVDFDDECIMTSKLEYLNLSSNSLGNLDEKCFSKMKSLKSLDLSFNFDLKLCSNAFKELCRLEKLSLGCIEIGGNRFHLESEFFFGLKSLKCLDLNHNSINHVDSSILCHMPKLSRLIL